MSDWWPSAEGWAAIATFLAVLVALFGDWVRAQIPWLQPKLRLALEPGHTVTRTRVGVDPNGREVLIDSVYFHARIFNPRRGINANQVQAFIVRQEMPDASGVYQTQWASEVPVIWDYQEVKPLQMTVGPHQTFPVCSIVKDKYVQIHPLIKPYSLQRRWRESFRAVITFVAKSTEVDSNRLRVEIAWDGKWSDDKTRLGMHLTVRELKP